MIIKESEAIGVTSAEITVTGEDDKLDLKFEEIENAYGGTRKDPRVRFYMVPGDAKSRKAVLSLMNIFLEHDKKFVKIVREFGHQKTLPVK